MVKVRKVHCRAARLPRLHLQQALDILVVDLHVRKRWAAAASTITPRPVASKQHAWTARLMASCRQAREQRHVLQYSFEAFKSLVRCHPHLPDARKGAGWLVDLGASRSRSGRPSSWVFQIVWHAPAANFIQPQKRYACKGVWGSSRQHQTGSKHARGAAPSPYGPALSMQAAGWASKFI